LRRGEDKGEGFGFGSSSAQTLTLPLSALRPVAIPGEATLGQHGNVLLHAKTTSGGTNLKEFLWISHPPRSRPLIVQLPALLH